MKNLPSGFGIKRVVSARERRPNGTLEVRNRKPGSPKGTYGRHTAFRNGDCFRGLVSLVSPRQAQQKTLRALREYDDMEHYVPNEDSKKTERPESV